MESCSSRLPWWLRVAPASRRRSFSSFSAPVRYQPNLIIFEGLFSDQLICRRPTLQATETLGWGASWTICTRYSHTFAYLSDICSVHHRPSDLTLPFCRSSSGSVRSTPPPSRGTSSRPRSVSRSMARCAHCRTQSQPTNPMWSQRGRPGKILSIYVCG